MARLRRVVSVSSVVLVHLVVACGLELEGAPDSDPNEGLDASNAPRNDATTDRSDAASHADGGDAASTRDADASQSLDADIDTDADAEPVDACVPDVEICDGLDNDCDDQIDEGCECSPGSTSSCYSGPPGTVEVGRCVGGTRTCRAEGTFGPCVGEIVPTAESCNGQDDDCDGQTDEGNPGGGGNCASGSPGRCAAGTLRCENGQLRCIGAAPIAETCNGQDDDCDGETDDGDPGGGADCEVAGEEGACKDGSTRCVNGQIQCVQTVQASAERCDGIDNDCDGEIDEGDPEGGAACNTGEMGLCAPGTETCKNGALRCVPTNPMCL